MLDKLKFIKRFAMATFFVESTLQPDEPYTVQPKQ